MASKKASEIHQKERTGKAMKTRKKRLKLGRVVLYGYVVNLNDKRMVKDAKDCLVEDILNAVKREEIEAFIEAVEDPSVKEEDIPDFLLNEEA